MLASSPCYGCQERSATCHADCAKYQAYADECEQRRRIRSTAAMARGMTSGVKKALKHKTNLQKQGRKP